MRSELRRRAAAIEDRSLYLDRLMRLVPRFAPETWPGKTTATDLMIRAYLEQLWWSHGNRVRPVLARPIEQLCGPWDQPVVVTAAEVIGFVRAVSALDAPAAQSFWEVVEFCDQWDSREGRDAS